MGTITTIIPLVKDADACEAFSRLISRLEESGTLGTVEIVEQVTVPKKSTTLVRKGVDPSTPAESWAGLAEKIVDSDKKLEVSFALWLPHRLASSGDALTLDVELYGKRYRAGSNVKMEGPIQLTMMQRHLSDWSMPNQRTHDEIAAYNRVMQSDAPDKIKYEALQTKVAKKDDMIFRDAADMFLLICGRQDGKKDASIDHAFMYQEGGIVPPYACNMIFHADIAELRRDVARNYAAAQWGTPTRTTLDPSVDILGLKDSFPECRENAVRNNKYITYEHSIGYIANMFRFLLSYTEEDAVRCDNLSPTALKLLLDSLNDQDFVIEPHCYDDGAVALIAHPRLYLDLAYQYFVESTRPGGQNDWLIHE